MEKKKNTIEGDKISNLPDSILHHIFSFLNMEEAVRSSVLSKRWRHLWISLPTLNFEYRDDDMLDDMRGRCKRFVDKVFILRDGSNIQKFDILCHRLSSDCVNDWIISALRRKVQELVIELCFDDPYRLPNCFFDSKSLTILNLSSWATFLKLTNIPDSMCLPSLKTMSLRSLSFSDDDQTNRFFSSCPVLESLTIKDSEIHHTNLRISSYSLKHLVIENCENDYEGFGTIDGSVKLYTPNLISFGCKDYMEKNYYLENLSSLVEADFYLTEHDELLSHLPELLEVKKAMYGQRILKFLGALHNVTKLTLPAPYLEVVSAPALLESNFIYRRNLRNLKMDAPLSVACIHTIICLLKMCPTIETLFVKKKMHFDSSLIEVDWEVGLSSECLLNHLKCVEIREAKGCVNELTFLETLLKNAVVLDTLMIVFSATNVSASDRQRQLVKFREKLRALPKASPSITTMLI